MPTSGAALFDPFMSYQFFLTAEQSKEKIVLVPVAVQMAILAPQMEM